MQEFLPWLSTDSLVQESERVLCIGDFNAFKNETPLRCLESNGYTNLVADKIGEQAYSYHYGGESACMDHAFANEALVPHVTQLSEWHCNADEAPTLSYYLAKNNDGSSLQQFSDSPYRSSDHDPLLIGLQLPCISSVPQLIAAKAHSAQFHLSSAIAYLLRYRVQGSHDWKYLKTHDSSPVLKRDMEECE